MTFEIRTASKKKTHFKQVKILNFQLLSITAKFSTQNCETVKFTALKMNVGRPVSRLSTLPARITTGPDSHSFFTIWVGLSVGLPVFEQKEQYDFF